MRWIGVLSVFACLSCAPADPKPAAPEGEQVEPKYFYWHENERIPLTLDTTRIVYLGAGDVPENATTEQADAAWAKVKGGHPKALAKAGIAKERVKANDQFHFWEVDLSDRNFGEAEMAALIGQLAADESTEFAGPVRFYKDTDMLMLPTRHVIVVFVEPGKRQAALDAFANQQLGAPIAESYMGLPNHWLVRLRTKNGFEALRAANAFHVVEGVDFCEHDWRSTGRVGLVLSDPPPRAWQGPCGPDESARS